MARIVEVKRPVPEPLPPVKVVLELDLEEAIAFRDLLGRCVVNGPTSETYRALNSVNDVAKSVGRYVVTDYNCNEISTLYVRRKNG